jgi:hypothetical protein
MSETIISKNELTPEILDEIEQAYARRYVGSPEDNTSENDALKQKKAVNLGVSEMGLVLKIIKSETGEITNYKLQDPTSPDKNCFLPADEEMARKMNNIGFNDNFFKYCLEESEIPAIKNFIFGLFYNQGYDINQTPNPIYWHIIREQAIMSDELEKYDYEDNIRRPRANENFVETTAAAEQESAPAEVPAIPEAEVPAKQGIFARIYNRFRPSSTPEVERVPASELEEYVPATPVRRDSGARNPEPTAPTAEPSAVYTGSRLGVDATLGEGARLGTAPYESAAEPADDGRIYEPAAPEAEPRRGIDPIEDIPMPRRSIDDVVETPAEAPRERPARERRPGFFARAMAGARYAARGTAPVMVAAGAGGPNVPIAPALYRTGGPADDGDIDAALRRLRAQGIAPQEPATPEAPAQRAWYQKVGNLPLVGDLLKGAAAPFALPTARRIIRDNLPNGYDSRLVKGIGALASTAALAAGYYYCPEITGTIQLLTNAGSKAFEIDYAKKHPRQRTFANPYGR